MAIRIRTEAWQRIPRGGRDGGPFPRGQGLVRPRHGPLERPRLPAICRSLRQVQGGRAARRRPGFLFVHGLLHLLGYDHMKKEDEEVMFKLQDDILSLKGV